MELKKKIGMALRAKRAEGSEPISQREIADAADISLRYYNYLENGQKMPTLDIIQRIAEQYGMKMSELCKLIEEQ